MDIRVGTKAEMTFLVSCSSFTCTASEFFGLELEAMKAFLWHWLPEATYQRSCLKDLLLQCTTDGEWCNTKPSFFIKAISTNNTNKWSCRATGGERRYNKTSFIDTFASIAILLPNTWQQSIEDYTHLSRAHLRQLTPNPMVVRFSGLFPLSKFHDSLTN